MTHARPITRAAYDKLRGKLQAVEAALTAERAAHEETRRERDELHAGLSEIVGCLRGRFCDTGSLGQDVVNAVQALDAARAEAAQLRERLAGIERERAAAADGQECDQPMTCGAVCMLPIDHDGPHADPHRQATGSVLALADNGWLSPAEAASLRERLDATEQMRRDAVASDEAMSLALMEVTDALNAGQSPTEGIPLEEWMRRHKAGEFDDLPSTAERVTALRERLEEAEAGGAAMREALEPMRAVLDIVIEHDQPRRAYQDARNKLETVLARLREGGWSE